MAGWGRDVGVLGENASGHDGGLSTGLIADGAQLGAVGDGDPLRPGRIPELAGCYLLEILMVGDVLSSSVSLLSMLPGGGCWAESHIGSDGLSNPGGVVVLVSASGSSIVAIAALNHARSTGGSDDCCGDS